MLGEGELEAALAAVGGEHLVAARLEDVADHRREVFVIVDDEDADLRSSLMAASSSVSGCSARRACHT